MGDPPPSRTVPLLEDAAWVRRLARSLAADAHEADDLAQEAWVVALEGGGLDRGRAWLGGVLRHVAWKARRVAGRRAHHEASVARPAEVDPAADLVARAALFGELVGAVMQLEEPSRSALLLRYLEELPPREIAKRLGVPVRTVAARLSRGLARLRAELDAKKGGREAWLPALVALGGGGARTAGAGPMLGGMLMGTTVKVAAVAGLAAVLALGLREIAGNGSTPNVDLGESAGRGVVGDRVGGTSHTPRVEGPRETASSVVAAGGAGDDRVPAGKPSGEPAPAEGAGAAASAAEELEHVLASYLTEEPAIDELEALVAEMSASAVIDPASVVKDPLTGEVKGSLAIEKYGLAGTFSLTEDAYGVSFQSPGTEGFFQRTLDVRLGLDQAALKSSSIGVQSHPNASDPEVVARFGAEERVVGWSVGTSLERGLRASPIVASRPEGVQGLRIGRSEGATPSIERPWQWDPGRLQGWQRLLEPYAGK